jgi:RimJ/RimL family protein N-acetyltransferase
MDFFTLKTKRLLLCPVRPEDRREFHSLVTDPHIRRYLMDGKILPPAWAEERIAESLALFDQAGLGIWLVFVPDAPDPVGFGGFMKMPDTGLGLEFIYALREPFTGRGLATELAKALLDFAAIRFKGSPLFASVDAVNVASVRVLEKLGFRRADTKPGAFGDMFIYRLETEG